MKRVLYAIGLGLSVLFCTPAQAAGNMACGQREDVLAKLGAEYHEAPSAMGVANNGGLLELLTTADGSTWTLIVSMPNGTSCLLAAGEKWQPVERPLFDPSVGTPL